MTVFRVGMRVRIKWSLNWPELSGTEGVVCAIPDSKDFPCFGVVMIPEANHIPVCPSIWGSCICPNPVGDAWWFAPDASQLEPILDQHQPCESEFKESLDRMLEKVVEVVR